jgi:hypothetical protein
MSGKDSQSLVTYPSISSVANNLLKGFKYYEDPEQKILRIKGNTLISFSRSLKVSEALAL